MRGANAGRLRRMERKPPNKILLKTRSPSACQKLMDRTAKDARHQNVPEAHHYETDNRHSHGRKQRNLQDSQKTVPSHFSLLNLFQTRYRWLAIAAAIEARHIVFGTAAC